MMASQQSRLREHRTPYAPTSTLSTVFGTTYNIPQQTQTEELESEQAEQIGTDKQLVGKAEPPRYAVLFDSLRLAHWDYFGIPSHITLWFDPRLMHITAVEPNAVYQVLRSRLGLLDVYRDFAAAMTQAKASGMTEQAAETFASWKVILDIGKDIGSSSADVDKFVKEFDFRIRIAKRVVSLVDAFGVREVLLIHFDEDEVTLVQGIPMLKFIDLNDDEWESQLSQLLHPSLQLKEACLKLSGVIHMIEELHGMGQSELRTFLAKEKRYKAIDLARRLGEETVKNPTSPFYLLKCSVFSTLSNRYLTPSLLLVRANITSFTDNEHEIFSKRSSISIIDSTNFIFLRFNYH